MPGFERHVFICTNERAAEHPRGCCSSKQAAAVRAAFKAALKERGLSRVIRPNGAGCLDQCEHGVCAVVYPEGTWYGFLTPEDVPEIVREHLVGGRPVARLQLPEGCVNTARCAHKRLLRQNAKAPE